MVVRRVTAYLIKIALIRAAYVTGLTLLYSLIILIALPGSLTPASSSYILFAISLLLIAGSAYALFKLKQSMSETFFALGGITLIPGILAILFSVFSRQIILGLIESYVTQFITVRPLVESYLDSTVPAFWLFAIFYLVLGIFFILAGIRMRKRGKMH